MFVCLGVQLPSFPGLVVKAKYATEHRCGIVVSGPGLSDDVSGTDPLKDNLPLQVFIPVLLIAKTHGNTAQRLEAVASKAYSLKCPVILPEHLFTACMAA